jgi:hypothetical protein
MPRGRPGHRKASLLFEVAPFGLDIEIDADHPTPTGMGGPP